MKTTKLINDIEFWKNIQRTFKRIKLSYFCHANYTFADEWYNRTFRRDCWKLVQKFNKLYYPNVSITTSGGRFSVLFDRRDYGIEKDSWCRKIRLQFLRWIIAELSNKA